MVFLSSRGQKFRWPCPGLRDQCRDHRPGFGFHPLHHLTWTKVPGATAYDILGQNQFDSTQYQLLASVGDVNTDNAIASWTGPYSYVLPAWNETGSITVRGPINIANLLAGAAPFSIPASAPNVTNLDADKVDGVHVNTLSGGKCLHSVDGTHMGEAAADCGSSAPPGSDKSVPFNDGGAWGSLAGFTFDKATGELSLPGPMVDVRGGFGSPAASATGQGAITFASYQNRPVYSQGGGNASQLVLESDLSCQVLDTAICTSHTDSNGHPDFATAGSGATVNINGGSVPLVYYVAGARQVINSNLSVTCATPAGETVNFILATQDLTNSNPTSSDLVCTPLVYSVRDTAPSCPGTGVSSSRPSFYFDKALNQMRKCTSNGGTYSASPAIPLAVCGVSSTPTVDGCVTWPYRLNAYKTFEIFGSGTNGTQQKTTGTTTLDGYLQYSNFFSWGATFNHTQFGASGANLTPGMIVYSQTPVIIGGNSIVTANGLGRSGGTGGANTGNGGSAGGLGGGTSGGGGGGGTGVAGNGGGKTALSSFSTNLGGGNGGAATVNGGAGQDADVGFAGLFPPVRDALFSVGCSGASGGGGGGDGSHTGGNGGAGGGNIYIKAPAILVLSGSTISANGGDGAAPATANAGGGGAGAGGCAILVGGFVLQSGTLSANAGNAGSGAGTGGSGGAAGTGISQTVGLW